MACLSKTLPLIMPLEKTRQSYPSLLGIAPVEEEIYTEQVLDTLLHISKNVSYMVVR